MLTPPPAPGRWTSAGAALLLALLAAGGVATALGASSYPGGTWVDPGTRGHSLWGNFLCDIARDMAVNGMPHPGAPWGRLAEWALVAALWLFWWLVPALLGGARLRRPVRALGTLGTLGLALVPVTAGAAHVLALVTGAGPGLAAAALVVSGLRARPWLALAGLVALLLAALELALYLQFRDGPLPITVPAMQRLALLAAVGWMGACAVALLLPQEVATGGASSSGSPRAT